MLYLDVDAESCLELVLQALYIASLSVKPNGKVLTKVFQQGNSFDLAQKAFRTVCKSHVICKPQAARKESMEWFILGSGIQARPFDKAKFIQKLDDRCSEHFSMKYLIWPCLVQMSNF